MDRKRRIVMNKNKELKIRGLVAKDLITFSNLVSKLDLPKEVGFEGILGEVFKQLPKIQSEVFNLLADLYGLGVEEVSSMPLTEFGKLLNMLIKSEDIVGFFTAFNS
jgi:hypothetical protein